jgi:hypothetical protein
MTAGKGRYPNTKEFSEKMKKKVNASNKASGLPPPSKSLHKYSTDTMSSFKAGKQNNFCISHCKENCQGICRSLYEAFKYS